MFQISLVDQVRLSFASTLAAYEGHTDAAATLARWNAYGRLALLVISGASAALGALAVQGGYGQRLGSAILAAAVFASCAVYVALNRQPLIYGHRASAARLWMICEQYRALLAEIHDEVIDLPSLRERRNVLLAESAAVLEQIAPDDRFTYRIAREALSGPQGNGYPDSLIDRYLPQPLRKPSPIAEAS